VHPAVQSFAIESFDDWRKLLDATYVRLAADRTATGPFCGHIDHARCGGITLSTMVSGGRTVGIRTLRNAPSTLSRQPNGRAEWRPGSTRRKNNAQL
jgi:hypothetical protein